MPLLRLALGLLVLIRRDIGHRGAGGVRVKIKWQVKIRKYLYSFSLSFTIFISSYLFIVILHLFFPFLFIFSCFIRDSFLLLLSFFYINSNSFALTFSCFLYVRLLSIWFSDFGQIRLKPNGKRNFDGKQLIFRKHNNFQCPNAFWKFAGDRIINIEVIKEVILRVTDFQTTPWSMQHSKNSSYTL